MIFWFRTDASFLIGTGHVMRCLTLADALRARGGDCHFVCRAHTGHLAERVRQHGYPLHLLPAEDPEVGQKEADVVATAHAEWLGTDWQTDATQTLSAMGEAVVDWLIVDHYALDARWEQRLHAKCRKIMVIDDLADRPHDCDLLLDQNLIADWQHRYHGRVSKRCGLMLGPYYALLQSWYAELHERTPRREGPVRRLLVYFGGADNDNLTGMAVSAFLSLQRADVELDVVINPAGIHAESVRVQVREHPYITLHMGLPSLAPLMVKADLAIGASGATSWERCCLGLPSLVVTLAENQEPIAAELDRWGAIRWLGHKDQVKTGDMAQALAVVLNDDLPPSWSERCNRIVDGGGTARVCAALMLDTGPPLRARPAKASDEVAIRQWSRASTGEVEVELARFRQGLRDPAGCHIHVVETDDGLALALARFEKSGDAWEIGYVIDPRAIECGLEEGVLQVALCALRKSTVDCLLFGRIENRAVGGRRECAGAGREAGAVKSLAIAICADEGSWINDRVPELVLEWLVAGHRVAWAHTASELPGGDICLYLSYGRIVDAATRSRYLHNLVVHASDLPKGRGWSPASWLILDGAMRIPVTLLEAVDQVDAGPIYLQEWIDLDGDELIDEWRGQLAQKSLDLARSFVDQYPHVLDRARAQEGETSFYPRRRAKDSALDPRKTIAEQMNLLRIVDNDNYPAYFSHNGKEYVVKITKR